MSAPLTVILISTLLGVLAGAHLTSTLEQRSNELAVRGDLRPTPRLTLSRTWWPLLVATGAGGAGVALWAGSDPARWVWWPLAVSAAALTVADVTWRLLPTTVLAPTGAATAALTCLIAGHGHDPAMLLRAGGAAAGTWVLFAALALSVPRAMGFGDVRLAAVLAGTLASNSWQHVAVGLLLAFVFGAVLAAVSMVVRSTRGVPFGPALLAGAGVSAAAGSQLWDTYIRLVLGA